MEAYCERLYDALLGIVIRCISLFSKKSHNMFDLSIIFQYFRKKTKKNQKKSKKSKIKILNGHEGVSKYEKNHIFVYTWK